MNDALPQPTLVPDVPTEPLPAKGSALAEAVRTELRTELQKADYVDFIGLKKLRELAHHGRLLVAVRNPMVRFDARAMADTGAIAPPDGYGTEYEETDDDCDYPMSSSQAFYTTNYALKSPPSSWDRGPMAKHFQEQQRKAVEEMLRESPLARALRVELLELVDRNPFSASELLEVEQLATQGLATLEARCGITSAKPHSQRLRRGSNMSMGGYMMAGGPSGAWAPSSSDETFGATAIRALGAQSTPQGQSDKIELVRAIAVAKEAGLDDVVTDLRAQLSPSAKPSGE